MRLKVKHFINQLMTSNCYIVVDGESKHCLCIDPASEKSEKEIDYITQNELTLDYIILTHEHTDHTWGVNALKDKYNQTHIICSQLCNKYAPKASKSYFLFYYDRLDYRYIIYPADMVVKKENEAIDWQGHRISFMFTPGHSPGSMCIEIDDILFTGDTIMPFKPYFNGHDSNQSDWRFSIAKLLGKYTDNTIIYPGHGKLLSLIDWKSKFYTDVNI